MNGVFPDVGLGDMIQAWYQGVGQVLVHLCQNNVTISRASQLPDFVECTFSGYAPQPLGTPGAPVYDPVNHWYSLSFPPLTFQNSTGSVGNSVYAVYFTDPAGKLVYAEEVSGGPSIPVDMNSAGKSYIYTAVIQQLSQYATSP